MTTDLTVLLADRPGTLATLGETLGRAGINIEGMCGFPCEGRGLIHVLVEDAPAARQALEAEGHDVRMEREVLVVDLEDQPGTFGALARRIADQGVNVDLVYIAANSRIVVGADDMEAARTALHE